MRSHSRCIFQNPDSFSSVIHKQMCMSVSCRTTSRPWQDCVMMDWKASSTSCCSPSSLLLCSARSCAVCLTPGGAGGKTSPLTTTEGAARKLLGPRTVYTVRNNSRGNPLITYGFVEFILFLFVFYMAWLWSKVTRKLFCDKHFCLFAVQRAAVFTTGIGPGGSSCFLKCITSCYPPL